MKFTPLNSYDRPLDWNRLKFTIRSWNNTKMAFKKRGSKTIEKAEARISAMRSVDSYLSLGDNLNLPTYETAIAQARQKVNAYNTALSMLTQLSNEAIAAEKELADLSERMFTGLVTKYGRNSTEYEMAGGKPRDKKRKKAAPLASSSSSLPTLTTTIIATNGSGAVKTTKAAQNGKVSG
jgi:hypothetical protein